MNNLTVVTGLWNIGRNGRPFEHYIEHFRNFLDIPQNLFIFIEQKYEYLVWEKRSRDNTYVKVYELEDVKNFFFKHYTPSNAILVVAGDVSTEQVKALSEKWFGDIPSGNRYTRLLPQEKIQEEERRMTVRRKVPMDAIYKTWHMCARNDDDYYATDLLTDILGGGASSRLYQSLVKEQQLFANINCYHFGSLDKGLLTIDGQLIQGVEIEKAEGYLAHKWGLEGNLDSSHPYKSTPPTKQD